MENENICDVIERSSLRLETLLLNLYGSEKITVIRKSNKDTISGTEEEITNNKPEWLKLFVTDIRTDPVDGQIHITLEETI